MVQKTTKLFVAFPAAVGGLWVSQKNAQEAVVAFEEDGQSEKEQRSQAVKTFGDECSMAESLRNSLAERAAD